MTDTRDISWLESFSIRRYSPLTRLLAKEDLCFVSSLSPAAQSAFRAQRRKLFRTYLKALRCDFNRLSRIARERAMESENDEYALLTHITRQQVRFNIAIVTIQGKLVLHSAGFGSVDVRALLFPLDALSWTARFPLRPLTTT